MLKWDIRRASVHDRKGLEALCVAAQGPDDYVIEMLDDFILNGVFHIALDGDRIIGAMHYTEAIDGSAWLAAARTHPAYRRRGVASDLIESLAELARRSGVYAIRLWSSASNLAGVAASRAAGLREVARFTRMVRTAATEKAVASPLTFDEDLSTRILDSPILRLANGYVPYRWYFVRLTPATVHLMANAHAFFDVGAGIACLSTPIENSFGFGLVAGRATDILRAIPQIAREHGATKLSGFLPQEPGIVAAARRQGFERGSWGGDAVLFERSIPTGPKAYRRRPTYSEIAARKREGYAPLALLAGHHEPGHSGPHVDRWIRD